MKKKRLVGLCAIMLLLCLLLTSCAPQSAGGTSSNVPPSSDAPTSSEAPSSSEVPSSSNVPTSSESSSSSQAEPPVSSETPKPTVSLKTNQSWNYRTVCDLAYIDANGKVHIAPDLMEYASAAKKYDGKTGAVSVVSLSSTYTKELWILWEDDTVSYIHPTIQEVAAVYPATDAQGNPKKDPTDYDENVRNTGETIYPDELEQHWSAVEAQLKGKKAAWIFGNVGDHYEGEYYYGFVDTNGTVRYYEGENGSFAKDAADEYVYVDGGVMVTRSGKAYGVEYLPSEDRHNRIELSGSDTVQASYTQTGLFVCLQKDGSLVFTGRELVSGPPMNTDEVAVRLFAGSCQMETADGRIVQWCGIDYPNQDESLGYTSDNTSGMDQIADSIYVFKDGTVECPEYESYEWIRNAANIKVLNK